MPKQFKTIRNIDMFYCDNNDCWMTEFGCDRIREAADNGAYCIKAGVKIGKIDEINLLRCSECAGCKKFTTLSKQEFIDYLQPLIDAHTEIIEASPGWDAPPWSEVGTSPSEYDNKRARWKKWYDKHVNKEETNGKGV